MEGLWKEFCTFDLRGDVLLGGLIASVSSFDLLLRRTIFTLD
jgi:hypothetical protein